MQDCFLSSLWGSQGCSKFCGLCLFKREERNLCRCYTQAINLLTQVFLSSIYLIWICCFWLVCITVLCLYLYINIRIWYCREALCHMNNCMWIGSSFWYRQHLRLWCEVSSVRLAFLAFLSWSVHQLQYAWEKVGYEASQVETLGNITFSEAIKPGSLTGQRNLFREIESVPFCCHWRKFPQFHFLISADTRAQNGSYW